MEYFFETICEFAPNAHWIFFLLLLLAGLNVPISEDLILITGGAMASTCIPEHMVRLYIWIYLGCLVSGWEAYWIGRVLGPKLYTFKWTSHIVTPHRVERLHHYYERFGIYTFIVGRFIPGGVRNALYLTSGLGKMPFFVFFIRDSTALLISSSVMFTLGYQFGKNYQLLLSIIKTYDIIVISILALVISGVLIAYWVRSRKTPGI